MARLGDTLRQANNWDGAIAAYTKAIQLDPKCGAAYSGRGHTWVSKHELDKAIADLDRAIRLDPKPARALISPAVPPIFSRATAKGRSPT